MRGQRTPFIRNGFIDDNASPAERQRARNQRFPGPGHSLLPPPPPLSPNLLNDIRHSSPAQLRPVPVYFVNRSTGGLGIRSHGYVMAGDPGRGRNSGAVFYGVGGDPKRGGVDIDKDFVSEVKAKKFFSFKHKFSSDIRSTVKGMRGQTFPTKEEFHEAYRDARTARNPSVSSKQVDKEVSELHKLAPKTKMEMWPKQPNGYQSDRPNTAEEDVRAFEAPRRFLSPSNVSLRRINNVRSIDLLEARQQFLLQQRYLDERHGRVGDGIPHSELRPSNPISRSEQRKQSIHLAASTPTFQRVPPLRSDTVANCNAGAATLLQSALDRFPNVQQRGQAQNANIFGLGYQHRMRLWDPTRNPQPQQQHQPQQQQRPMRINFSINGQLASQEQASALLGSVLNRQQSGSNHQAPSKRFPGKGHSLKD